MKTKETHNRLVPLLILCLFFTLLIPVKSNALDSVEKYTVTDEEFGATANDSDDDRYAIQAALNKAKNTENTVKVIIPSGTYIIESKLYIYSNTILELADDATVIMVQSSNSEESGLSDDGLGGMLYGVHLNEDGNICKGSACTHGEYSQAHDITVTGGTWDRNDTDGEKISLIMVFRHCDNITFSDLTLKNCTNHMLNASGCSNVLVDGVNFKDQIEYKGTSSSFWKSYKHLDKARYCSVEAIHTDVLNKTGESGPYSYPLDNTPSKNVTVQNCTFNRVFSGIGTHHSIIKSDNTEIRSENFKILNNTFTDIYSFAVYAYNFDNLIMDGNTVTRASGLIRLCGSSGTVSNNYCDCTEGKYNTFVNSCITADDKPGSNSGVHAVTNTNTTVSDNTLIASHKDGIYAADGAKLTVKNNIISGVSKQQGIYVKAGSKVISSGNELKDIELSGIRVDNSTLKSENDKISNCKENGIFASASSNVETNRDEFNNIESSGLRVKDSVLKSNNDKISDCRQHGVFASDSSTVNVKNAVVSGISLNGIYGTSGSTITADNNTVSNSGATCIRVNEGTLKATGNTLTNAEMYGIYGEAGTSVTAKKNSVSGIKGTSSGSCGDGITVKNGTLTADKNTVKNTYRYGIWAEISNSTITNNNVTATGNNAVFTRGNTSKTVTSSITGNTAKTSGKTAYDIKIDGYCKNCLIAKNTVGSRGIKYGSTVELAVGYPVIGISKITSSGITLNWDEIYGASYCIIYRSTNGGKYVKVTKITDMSVHTYTDKEAKTNNTKYAYKIKAYSSSGKAGSYSNTVSYYYYKAPTLTLSATSTGVKISWSKITDSTGYYVYKSTDGKKYTLYKTITKNTTVNCTDKSAKNGKKYYYKVCAYKNLSDKKYTGASSAVKSTYFLSCPAISSAANKSAGKIKVAWNKNGSATGYQVKYVTGKVSKTVTVSGASTLTKTLSSLKKGSTYKVYVRSYIKKGTTSYYSAWSTPVSVKITK